MFESKIVIIYIPISQNMCFDFSKEASKWDESYCLFVWFDILDLGQQSFCYVGTGLSGLNQY